MIDPAQDPYGNGLDDDQRRAMVVKALLAQQQQPQGGGIAGGINKALQMYGQVQQMQNGREAQQTKALGMAPQTFPAFDDSGGAMPRGPGMVQPNLLDKLQAFFAGGG